MITWLASYPKSGNTWVRLLLSTYQTGQCDINNIQGTLLDYQPHFYKSLLTNGEKPVDVMHIRTAALYHMDQFFVNPVLKTHWGNYEVFGIKAIPPAITRRAIVIVRDPRDLAISLANFYQQSIDEVIQTLNNPKAGTFEETKYYYLGTWSDYVRSWKQAKYDVLLVKYEDLRRDTVKVFANMLDFLEKPRKNVKNCVEQCEFSRLQAQEQANGFVEQKNGAQFFYQGTSTWAETLTEAQITAITQAHEEQMGLLGYL